MLDRDELWLMDELPPDEPAELLRAMPEIKQYVASHPDEEEGLRSILEHPDVLSKAWWRHADARKRRTKYAKRHPGVLHAA